MIRAALVFCLVATVVFSAQEPRAVAEEALAAWRAGDAKRLDAVAHPELKRRLREARLVKFYVEGKDAQQKRLESGSEADVVALFCEALRAIVPRDARSEHFDRFIETHRKGDFAIVAFESGWRAKDKPTSGLSSKIEIVLKKEGDDWRFLWSPSVQIHTDLVWDPRP